MIKSSLDLNPKSQTYNKIVDEYKHIIFASQFFK